IFNNGSSPITISHNPNDSSLNRDLKELIVKGLGFQVDDFKISGFDLRDSLVGQSVVNEFDIEIFHHFKLLEDVNRWKCVELPIFQTEEAKVEGSDGLVTDKRK
ncbi:hypothetical protein GIB67_004176, partial [Kingdonia uniflora]